MNKDTIIVGLEATPLNLPLNEPFSIATGSQHEVNNVLLKITLASGISGLGEAAPFPAVSGETQQSSLRAIDDVRELILGKDIRNWKNISDNIAHLLIKQEAALCGLQMAMADALTKYYKIPLAVLFGGTSDTLITDMTIPASDAEHAAISAQEILKRGINTIKIKTSGVDVDFDFERIRRISQVAPKASLIIDGNCGYNLTSALRFINKIRQENIFVLFYEQLLPREQWDDMKALAVEPGVRIAADESARSASDVLRIVNEKSAHVVNIKLMKCGLTEALRMVEIAKAAGLELMIGGMVETILSMSFSAHFAAGLGGFNYADLDTPLFIKSHPFKGGFHLSGDVITVDFSKPGHGVALA